VLQTTLKIIDHNPATNNLLYC